MEEDESAFLGVLTPMGERAPRRPSRYFTAQGGLHDGSVAHGGPMLDDWGSHAVAGMIRLQARARVAGASTRGHSVLSDERVVVQVASRAPPAHGGVWI